MIVLIDDRQFSSSFLEGIAGSWDRESPHSGGIGGIGFIFVCIRRHSVQNMHGFLHEAGERSVRIWAWVFWLGLVDWELGCGLYDWHWWLLCVLLLHSDKRGFLLRFGCKTPTRPHGFQGGLAESFSAASFLLSEERQLPFRFPLIQFCHPLEEQRVCTLHVFMSSHTKVVCVHVHVGSSVENGGGAEWYCAQVVGKQFWIALCALICSWFWIIFQCHVWILGFSNIQWRDALLASCVVANSKCFIVVWWQVVHLRGLLCWWVFDE